MCAICGDKKKLSVDHCHETKKIRSLLCIKCNTMLGNCKESVDILKKAIKYLLLHQV